MRHHMFARWCWHCVDNLQLWIIGCSAGSCCCDSLFVSAGGLACLLCSVTSGGLQRIWALAGRFGAASALSLAQLYTAELLSSDVQHAALIASAQVIPDSIKCLLMLLHASILLLTFVQTGQNFTVYILIKIFCPVSAKHISLATLCHIHEGNQQH